MHGVFNQLAAGAVQCRWQQSCQQLIVSGPNCNDRKQHACNSVLAHLTAGPHDRVWSATQAGRQFGVAATIGAQGIHIAASLGHAWLGELGWVVGVATIGALARYN